MATLPSLFAPVEPLPPPEVPQLKRVGDMRHVARAWTGQKTGKIADSELRQQLEAAFDSDEAARRVVDGLRPDERDILAVFRRHGNQVPGAVLRVDLLTRGLVEIARQDRDYLFYPRWKRNPVPSLASRLFLLRPVIAPSYNYHDSSTDARQPFATYTLHPRLAEHITPAGPTPALVEPLTKGVTPLGSRPLASVTLDLARVFAFVAARKTVRLNQDGTLPVPVRRALIKAMPLAEDAEFPLPDQQGLYFELLREARAIVVDGEEVRPAAGASLFGATDVLQAHTITRSWMHSRHWLDGEGMTRRPDDYHGGPSAVELKQVLAWALGSLAAAGDEWFSLDELFRALAGLFGTTRGYYRLWHQSPWHPGWNLDQSPRSVQDRQGSETAFWCEYDGRGLANALMITLPALGLVERGRCDRKRTADAFRLTPLGRAVFGAPDVPLPPKPAEQPFLIVQPNFDVLAYLDQASAHSAGLLGRLTQYASGSGNVQSFHLSRDSVYQALESGLDHEQVVAFLTRFNRGPVPANVLQTIADWSARRESLVLRTRVTLVGFPDEGARDTWLAANGGKPCGERFVLALASKAAAIKRKALGVDHRAGGRQTWVVSEDGILLLMEPPDIVQRARLRRLAEPEQNHWRLTADSVARAAAGGLKRERMEEWLDDHLSMPLPPLLRFALQAWSGKELQTELAEATLLYVADVELFRTLAGSPSLQPYLSRAIGPGWLAVQPGKRQELETVLAELGIRPGSVLPLSLPS